MNLGYKIHSGKRSNALFYLKYGTMAVIPRYFFRLWAPVQLWLWRRGQPVEEVMRRVDYYNRLESAGPLSDKALPLARQRRTGQSAYFYDFLRTHRWFRGELRARMLTGDITYVPEEPCLMKCRPILGDNRNSVLLKLNSKRHFIFVNDCIPYDDKLDQAIFRGGVFQPHRKRFMEMYFGHPMVDAAESNKHPSDNPPAWRKPRISIYDHLKYKFIMALEGNDVASNLKWIMSSNSVAVMPRPTYETWFMEGQLIPDYHYIEIKSDFSDLEERLRYYIAHPDEARAIVEHANAYVDRFRNRRREQWVEWLVLDKYFRETGQLTEK